MEKPCRTNRSQQSQLILKSSEIHAERLKKLKQKILFQTLPFTQTSHYTGENSFINTRSVKSHSVLSNMNEVQKLVQKSFRKQSIVTPNKSKYFQSMHLKNIQSENKILCKKIERIIKRKSNNSTVQYKGNEIKEPKANSSFVNYKDTTNQTPLMVTSSLAEDFFKNKEKMSSIKQKQIRNENMRLLQRLMTLKPTIQTRKILSQTKKQNQLSKRLSKFNLISENHSQKGQLRRDKEGYIFSYGRKKDSLDSIGDTQQDLIPSNSIKRRNSVNYNHLLRGELQHRSERPIKLRRARTNDISDSENFKLPILSPMNRKSIDYTKNDLPKNQRSERQRALSQNFNFVQTPQYNYKQLKYCQATNILPKRPNSTYKMPPPKLIQNNDRLAQQHKINKSSSKSHESDKICKTKKKCKSQNKSILLAEIHKVVNESDVVFRFLRFSEHYEIQIKDKNQRKKTPIQIQEELGSRLFSFFDYDYDRIMNQCLVINVATVKQQNRLQNVVSIKLREEYAKISKQKRYSNQAIRENDQAEEEDSNTESYKDDFQILKQN